MNSNTPETELITRARGYEEAALAEIYDRYSPGVFRYAAYLLGDSRLAEDCVAETFLRYLQALRNGGGPAHHLQAYLYRIAHNWITDQYRRSPPADEPLHDDLESGEDDPLQISLERCEHSALEDALMRLTDEQRRVLVLKYLQGYENDAVARLLEKPVGAIKSLQHRALEALRRILAAGQEEYYGSRE